MFEDEAVETKKVQFVIDRGYPHGVQTEEREYDVDESEDSINEDLQEWVLNNVMYHYNVEGEFETEN